MTNTASDKKLNILIGLVIVLVLTNMLTLFLMNRSESKLETSETERLALQEEVNELQIQLDEANTDLVKTDSTLDARNQELQAKIDQIQQLLKQRDINAAQIKKYKDDIDQLRYYIKKYQDEITVLKEENLQLTRQNTSLKQNVEAEQKKSSALLNENINLSNKVEVAKLLKTSDIKIIPFRERTSGKEVETNKSRSVEKVRICFRIAENQVASWEEKTVYARVINPSGKEEVITDQTESMFTANGQEMRYSAKTTFYFKNDGSQQCMLWFKSSNYDKGVYKVILYADGADIGSASFKLD